MGQLKIDTKMEQRIKLEEARIKQLSLILEAVKVKKAQEEMRHEKEMNQTLGQYVGFRDATQNKTLRLAELEAKFDSLKQANIELNKEHLLATQENQNAIRDNEEINSNLAKELALNKVLCEKNKAEKAVLEFNQQRVQRYAARAEFY